MKRLSFMGEFNKSEPVKSLPQAAASSNAAPAFRAEPQKSSSLKRTYTADSEGAGSSPSRSFSPAEQRSVTHSLGASLDHEVLIQARDQSNLC